MYRLFPRLIRSFSQTTLATITVSAVTTPNLYKDDNKTLLDYRLIHFDPTKPDHFDQVRKLLSTFDQKIEVADHLVNILVTYADKSNPLVKDLVEHFITTAENPEELAAYIAENFLNKFDATKVYLESGRYSYVASSVPTEEEIKKDEVVNKLYFLLKYGVNPNKVYHYKSLYPERYVTENIIKTKEETSRRVQNGNILFRACDGRISTCYPPCIVIKKIAEQSLNKQLDDLNKAPPSKYLEDILNKL